MKICFFAPSNYWWHTGRWVRYFQQEGHEVHVLSLQPPPEPNVQYHPLLPGSARSATAANGGAAALSSASTAQAPGLRGHLCRAYAGVPGLSDFVLTLRYRKRWQKLLGELNPDIVHGHYISDYGFYAAVCGYRPLVLSAWGSDVLVDPRQSVIKRAMVRYALRRCQAVISDAEFLSAEVRRQAPPQLPVYTVPMGIDPSIFQPPVCPVEDKVVILSVRSLERIYNIDTLLESMPAVASACPNAELWLMGKGSQRAALETRAQQLGLSDHVRFLGFVPTADLPGLMRTASVLVSIPSSDGTSVALLEGMASGMLPVVSDLPANREWVQDGVNGFVVPVRDTEALAGAMIRAVQAKALRRQCRQENPRIISQRAVWGDNMRQVTQLYGEVSRTSQS